MKTSLTINKGQWKFPFPPWLAQCLFMLYQILNLGRN